MFNLNFFKKKTKKTIFEKNTYNMETNIFIVALVMIMFLTSNIYLKDGREFKTYAFLKERSASGISLTLQSASIENKKLIVKYREETSSSSPYAKQVTVYDENKKELEKTIEEIPKKISYIVIPLKEEKFYFITIKFNVQSLEKNEEVKFDIDYRHLKENTSINVVKQIESNKQEKNETTISKEMITSITNGKVKNNQIATEENEREQQIQKNVQQNQKILDVIKKRNHLTIQEQDTKKGSGFSETRN